MQFHYNLVYLSHDFSTCPHRSLNDSFAWHNYFVEATRINLHNPYKVIYLRSKELDMNWDNYYKERYDATRQEVMDFHYKMGWIQGNLRDLQRIIDSGLITDKYLLGKLQRIANAIVDAETSCKEHNAKMAELTESK